MKKKMTVEELHKEIGKLHEEMGREIGEIKKTLGEIWGLISWKPEEKH